MPSDINKRIMNKIILTLAAVTVLGFAACAQNEGKRNMQTGNRPLVVYFSATGTTAKAARHILAAYFYPSELRHAFCPRLAPCENFFLYSFS